MHLIAGVWGESSPQQWGLGDAAIPQKYRTNQTNFANRFLIHPFQLSSRQFLEERMPTFMSAGEGVDFYKFYS
jgi:hypothetical protein